MDIPAPTFNILINTVSFVLSALQDSAPDTVTQKDFDPPPDGYRPAQEH